LRYFIFTWNIRIHANATPMILKQGICFFSIKKRASIQLKCAVAATCPKFIRMALWFCVRIWEKKGNVGQKMKWNLTYIFLV
jgi:hypothetical protein